MQNILYLSQLLPYPPDAGPKVRIYHVLRYLAERHRVTLVAFIRPDDKPEALEHLQKICAEVHTAPMVRSRQRDLKALPASLVQRKSFIIQRDRVPEMTAKVDRLLSSGRFDAVHADQLWMAQYALRSVNLAPTVKRVLDEHNACFQIFQRLAFGERNPLKRAFLEREWRALKRFEIQANSQFDHVVTVTEQDRQTLEPLVQLASNASRRPEYSVIPICIDPQAVLPAKPQPGATDILHLGTMFWLPNVEGVLWFGREVWPQVQARIPEATFTIVGKNPPNSIKMLNGGGLASGMKEAGSKSQVHVTGYVPDPRPFLEQAGVFVVPLHSGSGMRVKILDAWSWGLPVVSTRVGAEGIHYRDGENILIADSAGQFAQAVVQILRDSGLAQRLRENGRRWVETQYNWRTVYEAWDGIYA